MGFHLVNQQLSPSGRFLLDLLKYAGKQLLYRHMENYLAAKSCLQAWDDSEMLKPRNFAGTAPAQEVCDFFLREPSSPAVCPQICF